MLTALLFGLNAVALGVVGFLMGFLCINGSQPRFKFSKGDRIIQGVLSACLLLGAVACLSVAGA